MGQLVFLAQFGVLARTAQRGWWWWWWWRAPVDCRTNWPMIGCGGRRRQVLEGKVLHVAVVALGIRFQLHPSVSGYQSKCGLCSSFSFYSSSSSSPPPPLSCVHSRAMMCPEKELETLLGGRSGRARSSTAQHSG